MKKLLLFILGTAYLANAYANSDWDVTNIPDSLLQHANSVVRNQQITLTVHNAGSFTYNYHLVVTILNEKGDNERSITLYHNTFSKITAFKATVYDKYGKVLNRQSKSDLEDYGVNDGYSLYHDTRIYNITPNGGAYPFTIEYEYTRQTNGLIDYPKWTIQYEGQAVQQAQLKVIMPGTIPLYYKSNNINLQPDSTLQHGTDKVYTWYAAGLKPAKLPANSYADDYFLPVVDITPGNFEIEGNKGSWASWATFGKAMWGMWQNTHNLTPETEAEIKKLVKPTDTEEEKIARVYNYLQHNFRYVSVQIGVGGYIPFTAQSVHNAKYGDCKGLSNYMCAALAAVGIKSYPALINAGDDEHAIDPNFLSNNFNHAILCAITAKGPLWLECTSNAMPAGHLGSFTENRYALLLTDTGGVLVKTPGTNPQQNVLHINTAVYADSVYNCVTKVNLTGEYRSSANKYLVMGTDKERTTYLFNKLGLTTGPDYTCTNITDTAGYINFTVNSQSNKLHAFKSGGKTFLPSTLIKQWYTSITTDSTNTAETLLGFSDTQTEELTYHLRNAATSLPAAFSLNNDLLQFTRTVQQPDSNTVTITTQLVIKQYALTPAAVTAYKQYTQQINKYLQQKVVTSAL